MHTRIGVEGVAPRFLDLLVFAQLEAVAASFLRHTLHLFEG
jgi:hypothetical protein